jgi:hypothetical protein
MAWPLDNFGDYGKITRELKSSSDGSLNYYNRVRKKI